MKLIRGGKPDKKPTGLDIIANTDPVDAGAWVPTEVDASPRLTLASMCKAWCDLMQRPHLKEVKDD